MTMKKTIVRFEKIKGTENMYWVFLSGDLKKISGRKFAKSLGEKRKKQDSDKITDRDVLLDFYDLYYSPRTDKIELGELLEQPIIDYYCKEPYITFDHDFYTGNAFDDGTENNYNGLPDILIPSKNEMVEIKTINRNVSNYLKSWYYQLQFYAYFWNKQKADTTKIKVEKLTILKYYVNDMDWQMKNYETIIPEYLQKFDIELLSEEEFEKLLKQANEKLEQILKTPYFKVNIKRCNFLWNGIKQKKYNRKVSLQWDKDDQELTRIIGEMMRE